MERFRFDQGLLFVAFVFELERRFSNGRSHLGQRSISVFEEHLVDDIIRKENWLRVCRLRVGGVIDGLLLINLYPLYPSIVCYMSLLTEN